MNCVSQPCMPLKYFDISIDISSNLALSRALISLAQNLIKVEITFEICWELAEFKKFPERRNKWRQRAARGDERKKEKKNGRFR